LAELIPLLGGRHGCEIAKRVDTAAAAIHSGLSIADISGLDLTYTPRDAVQVGAQAWEASVRTR
jgi:hypothetical protein